MKNVFEFLGLQKDHRKSNKVVQLVKHIDEVPDSKKVWPMIGQVKKDGVYALVVSTAKGCKIFARTGKKFTNVYHLESDMDDYSVDEFPVGVYIAELCCDECSLEQLSGAINPNRKKPLSLEMDNIRMSEYLVFHDFIPLEDFKKGYCKHPYIKRYSYLKVNLPEEYKIAKNTELNSIKDAEEFATEFITKGEEGVVYKRPDEGWLAGHKGYRVMKKVRGVSYDLRCIGVEEGKGKYKGLVANLIFKWKNGKTVKAMLGKGWTHDDAREMFKCVNYGHAIGMPDYRHMNDPIGKIFEVYALQESSKGKLRLPKVGPERYDKKYPDLREE